MFDINSNNKLYSQVLISQSLTLPSGHNKHHVSIERVFIHDSNSLTNFDVLGRVLFSLVNLDVLLKFTSVNRPCALLIRTTP